MSGIGIRYKKGELTSDICYAVNTVCKKYHIEPVCVTNGGNYNVVKLEFGDSKFSEEECMKELEKLFRTSSTGTQRGICGYRINCDILSP